MSTHGNTVPDCPEHAATMVYDVDCWRGPVCNRAVARR